jgi:hypothetical protein
VLPLDERFLERFDSELAGWPSAVVGDTHLLFGGMHRLQENAVINSKNTSHSVTAEVQVPEGGAAGVIIAHGGTSGGWSLYVHEGESKYCRSFVGRELFHVAGGEPLPFEDASTHWGIFSRDETLDVGQRCRSTGVA